tara:strand:- start:45 stop:1064 length:1020 start_codon:yes stop_codon:yes gene_type:complete
MYSAKSINISSIVTVVPDNRIIIDDERNLYSWTDDQLKKIKLNIGINERRVTSNNQTTFDLMQHAADKMFFGLSIDPSEVDAIICVTQTPDYLQPGNSFLIHSSFSFRKDILTLDINSGCSGFVNGLSQASALINNYKMKKVLLLCGDTISKLVNRNDQGVAPLFGDAASCILIEPSDEGLDFFSFGTDGSGHESLIVKDRGFRHLSSEKPPILSMNGNKVMLFSITEEPKDVLKLLDYSQLEIEDIDYFVMHQANKYILNNIAKRIKIPMNKFLHDSFSLYGNTSSASIPLAISNDLNTSIENKETKFLLSGFGVGLSWISIVNTSILRHCPEPIIIS